MAVQGNDQLTTADTALLVSYKQSPGSLLLSVSKIIVVPGSESKSWVRQTSRLLGAGGRTQFGKK